MKRTLFFILWLLGLSCRTYSSSLTDEAKAKFTKGDFDGAIADYSKIIESNTNNFTAYNNRGGAEAAKGDFEGAIKDFTKAIELKPDEVGFYCNRGFAKQTQFDFDGAIVDYNKAAELKPGDNNIENMIRFAKDESSKSKPVLCLRRGIAKEKAEGDLVGALANYTKAIELKPDFAGAYNNRGWCEFQKNYFDRAVADATQAIQLNSTNRSFYDMRGWARYGKGDVTGALEDCKKAVGLSHIGTWAAVETQGLVNFIEGDYHMAFEQWNNSFQNDTNKQYLLPFIEKAKIKQSSPR